MAMNASRHSAAWFCGAGAGRDEPAVVDAERAIRSMPGLGVSSFTVTAPSGRARNMHFDDDKSHKSHILTGRACMLAAWQAARRPPPSATGWADGVTAGIPETFGERPWPA